MGVRSAAGVCSHSFCILALVAGPVASGCGGKGKGAADPTSASELSRADRGLDPTLCDTDKKVVEFYDLNHDDKPDVWKLYRLVKDGTGTSQILTCKQVDLDHDGRKDYVVSFNEFGGMVFEKVDFTFDGRFDALYKYEEVEGEQRESRLIEVARDSDFDGKYDITETYDTNGKLAAVQRDRNGDDSPDVWEQYEAGLLVAILYDDDFDQKVDRREEIEKTKPPQIPAAIPASPETSEPDTAPPAGDKRQTAQK